MTLSLIVRRSLRQHLLSTVVTAMSIALAVASAKEHSSTNEAVLRECLRYGLDYDATILAAAGDELDSRDKRRRWWDYAIVLVATAVFITLGVRAVVPNLVMNLHWVSILGVILFVSIFLGGWALHKRTRFS